MSRGPLYQDGYSPQFSGHETFPIRYGWLKKVFDCVRASERLDGIEHQSDDKAAGQLDNRAACWGDDAIARFGCGKNMVVSMRHWAKAACIIAEPGTNTVRTTKLGRKLFESDGLDPYLEHPTTLWLIHWQLAARAGKTTWFWGFSHFPSITFERDRFARLLERFARDRGWPTVASATIEKDIACFIRTYVARQPSGKAGYDDTLESPLTELGLIKAIGKKDGFRFVRGPKTTLGDGVFTYALMDFWARYSPQVATLSFEAIAHAPGGPGRVFQFEENDVVDRLAILDEVTSGKLRWSETAGLKQVVRNIDIKEGTGLSWLFNDYDAPARKKAG